MDFSLTQEQKLLVQSAEQFAKKDSPIARFRKMRADERGWEPALWRKMGELGWLGIAFAEEVGGFGGDLVDVMLVLEQLGRTLVPEPYLASVVLAGMSVAELGSEVQKEAVLAPLIEGKISLALAYAEEQGRYEPAEIRLEARGEGGGYVLTGKKLWVLNGHGAESIVVAARTSGEPGAKEGITLLLVDGDAKGLTRTPVHGMDGQRTAVLEFSGVKVGKDAVLGKVGGGLAPLERALDRAAAMAVAEGLGHARECLERTVEYLKVRVQFGVPIGSFQVLQHRAADMFAEVELLCSMAIVAAIGAGNPDASERKKAVSAAKVQLARSGWFVTSQAIQLHGGIGCTDEQDVGLFFKRMFALNHLFGDEDYHLRRYASLPGFAG